MRSIREELDAFLAQGEVVRGEREEARAAAAAALARCEALEAAGQALEARLGQAEARSAEPQVGRGPGSGDGGRAGRVRCSLTASGGMPRLQRVL